MEVSVTRLVAASVHCRSLLLSQEMYYKDFFEPPPRPTLARKALTSGTPQTSAARGKVRFHDQVRVKSITKRHLVSSLGPYDDDEEEEKEEGKDYEGVDDDGIDGAKLGLKEHEVEEGLTASDDNAVGDSDFANDRGTIERLKDDLFAEEELPNMGEILSLSLSRCFD